MPDGKRGPVSVSREQKSQTKILGANSTEQQGEETKEDDSMDSSSSEDSQVAEHVPFKGNLCTCYYYLSEGSLISLHPH